VQGGDVVDLSATNCERVVVTEETLVLVNVAEDAPELTDKAGNAEWGISCYLGTPVIVDDEVSGTFCFYDAEPRTEPFFDWEVTLVDLMGRWVGVALERELVEERLRRQNDRLEKFATLVSHDLRNPLNVAGGWLDIAREDCDSEALAKIEASHDRMQTLIDDVLALARAGRTVDDPAALDLRQVVTDAWEQVHTGEATLSLELDLTSPATTPDSHSCSRTCFGTRWSTGRAREETAFRSASAHSPAASTSGTTASVSPRTSASAPSNSVSRRPRTGRDGTGIGLGIVEDVATAHGWTVAVTESASGGARFEFTDVV
jgi:light-regulated signal transduction histidine kinase (bacteriophytochrome)